ncbi:MAG: hypothetical protein ACPGU7_04050 [Gammaproteobacteria bacterium]
MAVVAIDIGFGFTKATNGRESLVFKSVLGEATDIQYRESMLDEDRRGEHLHVELDGRNLFVGDLAERQSNVRSFTLDQNQFVSSFAKPLALTSLSHLVESNAPVNLVTGLPISYYQRFKDALARQLLGKHDVVRLSPTGEREAITVSVNKVRVIPQPFGSMFNLMLNDMGEVSNPRLPKEKVGIIDIGFRTADYTIADKTRYSERGSRSTESGIAKAFSVIAGKLMESTGINVELYRLYDAVDKGSIRIRGKNVDLKPMTEQVFNQLAAAVAAEVDRLWTDDWDIDSIVITGGGGKALAPYLKPLLNGEVQDIPENSDTRLNNVRGYWKYGKHMWERNVPVPSAPATES